MPNIHSEYEKTVEFLYSQLPMYQRDGASAFKKDLTNTLKLCEALGHPQHRFKSVHVAGTNGKGSSSHYLAAILQSAGYKTGLYTSPHLKKFTERIKINGVEITQSAVVDFVKKIKPTSSVVKPSFFEITVAMAFDYFASEQVDIAIIEVGMGGRLDSTNVIQPEVSLITNISKDHEQWLGNTLEQIAGEKAGIIKEHTPVVVSERQEAVVEVFQRKAEISHSQLSFATDFYKVRCTSESFEVGNISTGEAFQLSTITGAVYQERNLPGVLKVIDELKAKGFDIHQDHIQKGLENAFILTGLKGRWQKLGEDPLMFCDVAHNVDGIRHILNQLQRYEYENLHVVFGTVNDKDLKAILELLPKAAQYYFCQANIPRAMDVHDLLRQAITHGLKGEAIKDVNDAVAAARANADTNDFIFIGGSNFVVAEIDNL